MFYISKYNIYLKGKIYNLISKNYLTVNDELITYLKQNTKLSSHFPKRLIEVLKNNNIIVNYNESQYLDFKYNSLKFNSQKASFVIYPTLSCNFSCDYCFETVKTGIISNIDTQILKKFFNKKLKIFNDLNIRWSGGEPLLVWDKIKEILSVFEEYKGNFGVSMATNGYYLTDEIAQEMKRLKFSSVQITVDGTETEHNRIRYTSTDSKTYKKVLKGINNASKYLKTIIRFNVNDLNKNQFINFLEDLEKNNVNKNNIKIFVKPIREIQNCTTNNNLIRDKDFFDIELKFNEIAKEKSFYYALHPNFNSDIRCIYHQLNSFAIDPQLNLYKCAEQIGLDSHKIGIINRKSNIEINDIYEHSKMLMYSPHIIEECKNCRVLPICNGKCPIEWEKNKRKEHYGCIPEKKSIKYKIEQLLKYEL